MRVGVLTYHCIPNFGAQLQTMSTIGYLIHNGHEPVVMNWYPKDLEDYYLSRVPKEQNKVQFDFSQKVMPVSKLCRILSDLTDEIKSLRLDCIILGSDALFDYTPQKRRFNFSLRKFKKIPLKITSNHLLPNPFWGSFNDLLEKRVPIKGYAISSQNIPFFLLNKEEKKEICRLLDGFDAISVRDEWTQTFVKRFSHQHNVPIVPDPVFAFNQNFDQLPSKQDIVEKYGLPENYYLISFVHDKLPDNFINNIISLIEANGEGKCVSFPMPDKLKKYNTQYTVPIPLNPIDWYCLIKYSKGYIGERMHPIVVCLHNSIPFYCFDQYGTEKIIIPRIWKKFIPKSSKIYDILSQASLLGHLSFYNQIERLTPEDVVNRLNSFDVVKCNAFSQKQIVRYNEAMEKLVR